MTTRREFLEATAAASLIGSAADAQAPQPATPDQPGYYPPTRLGMRGSHPGSFEMAHALRDGDLDEGAIQETGEAYDLVVVGGGISGLASAYFWRKARPNARILILENHDDFGGHAKRNEIHVGGRTLLMNGGTLEIDSPRPYSPVASGLLADLGVRPAELAKTCAKKGFYRELGLKPAVFFDRETFGADKLVIGLSLEDEEARADDLAGLLAAAPLSPKARADIVRIQTGSVDYMPGLTRAEKVERLSRMSYRDYLLKVVKADPGVIPFYQTSTLAEFGVGIEAEPALDLFGFGFPGFKGLGLDHAEVARMGNTAAGYSATGGSASFHFPDGNASVARLLVRSLIPAALPGKTGEDIVLARCDYAELDRPGAPVRLRLNSVVVNAVERRPGEVELTYMHAGRAWRVRGAQAVMAGYNMMIPYIVPDLPEAQKAALHQMVKTPLVYTTVALSNWRAFARLGVSSVYAPGSYFTSFNLNPAESIGGYSVPSSPEEPMLVRFTRVPCLPGAATERDQNRAGRAELLSTPLETFEHHVRDQLDRTLGAGGFDASRDVLAVAVNRWPHGYAYEYNPLDDPWGIPESERPNVIGRRRFGRIAIANSDAGAAAYTDSAIDQAHRAVGELL